MPTFQTRTTVVGEIHEASHHNTYVRDPLQWLHDVLTGVESFPVDLLSTLTARTSPTTIRDGSVANLNIQGNGPTNAKIVNFGVTNGQLFIRLLNDNLSTKVSAGRLYNSGGLYWGATQSDPGATNMLIQGTLGIGGLLSHAKDTYTSNVVGSEGTTSSTYVTLTTPQSVAVTVPTGGMTYFVVAECRASGDSATTDYDMQLFVDGVGQGFPLQNGQETGTAQRPMQFSGFVTLAAGARTVDVRYVSDGNTSTFNNRRLSIMRVGV